MRMMMHVMWQFKDSIFSLLFSLRKSFIVIIISIIGRALAIEIRVVLYNNRVISSSLLCASLWLIASSKIISPIRSFFLNIHFSSRANIIFAYRRLLSLNVILLSIWRVELSRVWLSVLRTDDIFLLWFFIVRLYHGIEQFIIDLFGSFWIN